MTKRGVVAYSDVLRLEEGDRITVTTVYPGYIRTTIHEQSDRRRRPAGGLRPGRARRGRGPHARPRRARRAGPRPRHHPPGHAELRARCGSLPRRLVDAITRRQMRRLARKGHFDADGLAGEFAAATREVASTAGPVR